MASGRQCGTSALRVDSGFGIVCFVGWLFPIAFAKLIWWQAFLCLAAWPYYVGVAVR